MFKIKDRVYWMRSEDPDDTSAVYDVLSVLAKDVYVLNGVGDPINNAFIEDDYDHHLRPYEEMPYKVWSVDGEFTLCMGSYKNEALARQNASIAKATHNRVFITYRDTTTLLDRVIGEV